MAEQFGYLKGLIKIKVFVQNLRHHSHPRAAGPDANNRAIKSNHDKQGSKNKQSPKQWGLFFKAACELNGEVLQSLTENRELPEFIFILHLSDRQGS